MDKKHTERSPETAALIKKYRKQIAVTLILCLVSIGVIAGATAAWYANNRKVSASNTNITSETPTSSLYIARGETKDNNYYTSVTASAPTTTPTTNTGLYPISTVDCKDWYYVTGWTEVSSGDSSGSLIPKANKYAKVESPTGNGMAYTYTDSVTSKDHVAYYKQPFTIYTDRDSLDIYLLGLEVTADQSAGGIGTPENLMSGLRVAITNAEGTLLLYYAPNAEDGIGNSLNDTAAANTFYGISGTTENDIKEFSAPVTVYNPDTIDSILAKPLDDNFIKYNVADSTRFGEATEAGLVLYTYVWLEGTDAQTLAHFTGGISKPLSVKFTFVGVEKTTTTP